MQTRDPVVSPPATLIDLLDRVLDRGLLINADIVICLAGVPLIGINLRAALASMETMEQYGLMRDWDRTIRAGSADAPESRAAQATGEASGTPASRRPASPEDQ